MDFCINNETFAAAYLCLKDANVLLKNGLGNFNELDESALQLIDQFNVKNSDVLDVMMDDCQHLQNNMYKTIEFLSQMNVETALYFEFIFNNYISDISLSVDAFRYEVDLDDMLERHNNGQGLAFTGSLGTYYQNGGPYSDGVKYIEGELRKIWGNNDYTVREKITNGSLKHIELGIDVGRRVEYKYAGTWGDGGADSKVRVSSATTGIDCNAKVSFDIFNAIDCGIGWLSVPGFAEAGEEIVNEQWGCAQPADIFVRTDSDGANGSMTQHVGLIVRNNPSDRTFDVVESRPKQGVVVRTVSYEEMENNGYHIRDMGMYYGE